MLVFLVLVSCNVHSNLLVLNGLSLCSVTLEHGYMINILDLNHLFKIAY